MKIEKTYTSDKLTVHLKNSYLIEFNWHENIEILPEDIAGLDQIVYDFVGSKKFVSLAIFPKSANFGPSSHIQATQSEVNINMVAEAIVASELAQKIIFKWYSKAMESSEIPIKLFKSQEEAEQWLDEIATVRKIKKVS